jgi:2-oxoglutarate dehydrogenase E2 component (dihydrolipoamide succinyltransferase)
MPTDVVMPQMGESIFEGTITKWLKKPGDAVQKDEPLFEISTDKVDAEIPSPVSGVLSEIKAQEGETVEVNKVVAVIGDGAATAEKPVEKATVDAGPKPAGGATKDREGGTAAKPAERAGEPSQQGSAGGTEVVMPQMGESIFEGTITKWLKKAGDTVQKDEPLFEISTDKVDAEIASPVSGVLREIRIGEGQTVEVNTVVAVIGGAGAVSQGDGSPVREANAQNGAGVEARAVAPPSPAAMRGPAPDATPEPELSDESVRSSPLVRRMAREQNLDLRGIRGTGANGRVTKDDVLRYMKDGGATAPTVDRIPSRPATVTPVAAIAPGTAPGRVAAPQVPQVPLEGKLEPMSRMRAIIAQRMVESVQTMPHAYMVYKIDMTRVARLRERERTGFEQRHGVKLTYMPFIAAAAIEAIRKYPVVNAKIESNAVRYHENVHLGIAVALEWGLIVPVVREAERRRFSDMAAAIADLAERARTKKLKPEEASGSTFTLTNFGVFGGDFGTPIINPGESAILAIGALKKEPVVLTDAEGNDTIAIRSMQEFCLGFDHRLIDGADAGRFMMAFRDALEKWSGDIG